MDRLLRRQLDAIARDRTSGAAEIAHAAIHAVTTWFRKNRDCGPSDLLEIARGLCAAQPAMAPLLRICNDLAAATIVLDTRRLLRKLEEHRNTLGAAPSVIATKFSKRLPRQARVVTYSCSSTLVRAFTTARRRIRTVVCSESRPGDEGYRTASQLAKAGIWVQFRTDAELFSGVLVCDHVVIGADSVLRNGIVNKVGTHVLVQQALDIGASVWILTDTTKFWPETYIQFLGRGVHTRRPGWCKSIWKQAPRGVDALYTSVSLFDHTWFHPGMRLLTENGWMTPAQVRREIAKIKISPRLKELLQ